MTGPGELSDALARARKAQASWRRHSLSQRVGALRGFWRMLAQERESWGDLIASESGRSAAEAEILEFDAAGLLLSQFTRGAHRVLQDKAAWRPWVFLNKRAYVRQTPHGVVGLLTPPGSPFLVPFGDALPAWLAGNSVLLIPSDRTGRIAARLAERVRACSLLSEGLLEVVQRAPGIPEAAARQVDMLVFSGDPEEGRRLAAIAGERLIPAVVDISGPPVMIVAKDAPLERAAKAAAWAQPGSLLVERPALEGFTALLREQDASRVLPVGSVADAVEWVNSRPLPPSAVSLWTRDLDRGEEWAACLGTGAASVNDALGHCVLASLPCGAARGGGALWRHSDSGLLLFCRPQSVWVHEWPAAGSDPWWPPYSRARAWWLRLLARLA